MSRLLRWLEEPFHALLGIVLALCVVSALITSCGGKHSTRPVPTGCTDLVALPGGGKVVVTVPCPSPIPKPTPSPQPDPEDCDPPRNDCRPKGEWPKPPGHP